MEGAPVRATPLLIRTFCCGGNAPAREWISSPLDPLGKFCASRYKDCFGVSVPRITASGEWYHSTCSRHENADAFERVQRKQGHDLGLASVRKH